MSHSHDFGTMPETGGKKAVAQAFGMGSNDLSNLVVQADAPPMRAVSLMNNGPSLSHEAPRMGLGKPGMGLARPVMGIPSGKAARQSSYGVQKEWTGLTPSNAWEVKGEDLEVLPENFPLERTHRMIEGVDASIVAQRISSVLRSHSIETEYDCKQAKAKCKTSDYVSFRIRLYAGSENGDPVVVEVQRRCGSASSFMRSCRAILNAAEGKPLDDPPKVKLPVFKPIGDMKCLATIVTKEVNHEADAIAALDDVVAMLRSKQMDTNVLGLENLVALTDVTKTHHLVAGRVSKCVVMGDDSHDIREEIRTLTERDVYLTEVDAEDGPTKHADHLRHLALMVFANALSMCSKNGSLAAASAEHKWYAENLMPILFDEIKRAKGNACNAVSAVCCVTSLVKNSDIVRRSFVEYGGVEILQGAQAFGEAQHELLASESSRCLKTLDVPAVA